MKNAKVKMKNRPAHGPFLLLHFAFCILTSACRSTRDSVWRFSVRSMPFDRLPDRHVRISSSSPYLPSASPYLLIGLTCVTAAALCGVQSLEVPLSDIWPLAGLLLALAGLVAYYRKRGEAAFVLSLTSLAQIVVFVAGYVVLMYAVATLGRPLVDRQLASFDAWCGVSVPAIHQWASAHPMVEMLLNFAYDTLLVQTALVLIVLGLSDNRAALEEFIASFMLSALVSLGLFALFPADGPFATFGLPHSLDQAQFLDHFRTLRDGTRTLVTYRGAEGLITFPSYHVAWAILITWSLRHCRRPLFAAVLALNLLVVASTTTTGWHYVADVVGGAVVAVSSIVAVGALIAQKYAR